MLIACQMPMAAQLPTSLPLSIYAKVGMTMAGSVVCVCVCVIPLVLSVWSLTRNS
jgi:hypothetical protein